MWIKSAIYELKLGRSSVATTTTVVVDWRDGRYNVSLVGMAVDGAGKKRKRRRGINGIWIKGATSFGLEERERYL